MGLMGQIGDAQNTGAARIQSVQDSGIAYASSTRPHGNMNLGEMGAKAAASELDSVLDELRVGMSMLDSELGRLRDQLGPVTKSTPAKASQSQAGGRLCMSPIGAAISKEAERLQAMTRLAAELRESLAV